MTSEPASLEPICLTSSPALARRRLFGSVLATVCLAALSSGLAPAAHGQTAPPTSASVSAPVGPMPPLRLVVFGDSQGEGIAVALRHLLQGDATIKLVNRAKAGSSITQDQNFDWPATITDFTKTDHADIAVMMFGANDRLPIRQGGAAVLPFRSPGWKQVYVERIQTMVHALIESGTHVIWCGNPIAREERYSHDMGYLNGVYQEAITGLGVEFLPLWTVVADEQGNFMASGKGADGRIQRLRLDDGIHFTAGGYDIIARRIMQAVNLQRSKPS